MKKTKWICIVIIFTLLDLISKYVVSMLVPFLKEIIVIPNFFSITYTINRGVAFSFLSQTDSIWKLILIGSAAVITMGYIIWYIWHENSLSYVLSFAFAMISGGILGNFINRIFTGSVVDFIDFHYKNFFWPTFNLADTFITIGVLIFLIKIILSGDSNEA